MDAATLKRVALLTKDPRFFLKYACYTVDPYDQNTPVKAFPYDRPYIRALTNAWLDHPFNIIPKSRGMVISWTMCALHLHMAFTKPHQQIFMLAKSFDFAESALKANMINIYRNIPEKVWPQALRPAMVTKEGLISFPEIGSYIKVVPSGVDVLRGFSATAIYLDEFEFLADAEDTFAAARPTARSGGRLTLVSTYAKTFSEETDKRLFLKLIDDEIE